MTQEGLFRALLDCRVVLRALRSLASLLGYNSTDQLSNVTLEYDEMAKDLRSIPMTTSATELASWAEAHERAVYEKLDSLASDASAGMPVHIRFEVLIEWMERGLQPSRRRQMEVGE